MNRFDKYNLKELKAIIKAYKTVTYIPPYSKLKKAGLIELLNNKYEMAPGEIMVLKGKTVTKKRITPINVSKTVDNAPVLQDTELPGLKTYHSKVSAIERQQNNRLKMKKDMEMFKKIRGR